VHEGYVCAIRIDGGFGFIGSPGQPDVFFHMSDLADDLPFDETLDQRRVRFDVVGTAKGPRARNVRPAADAS
jgi:cold shock CspA family protein